MGPWHRAFASLASLASLATLARLTRLARFARLTAPALLVACGATPGPAATDVGPSATSPAPFDLLLTGGVVHTLTDAPPTAEALGVVGGRIAYVGSEAGAAPRTARSTHVVRLAGRHVYPGFADAHLHLAGYGRFLQQVDLVGTASYDEVIARTAAQAVRQPPGTWVLGRGWDQNDWADTAFPHHGTLSESVREHAVVLERVDGHAVLLNAVALRAAGIDASTPDPEGGRILRDATGAPTGVLIDRAADLVQASVPRETDAEVRSGVRRAAAELHRHGITAVHDPGLPASTVRLYADMARAGELRLRVHAMLSDGEPAVWEDAPDLPSPDLTGQGLLAVRAVKAYADGALGSRGAALLADYDDEPGSRGLVLTAPEALQALAERCLRAGWQLAVHAIGDAANRSVLDAYERAFAAVPPGARPTGAASPRFRVEHVQVLAPSDVPRFAALDVIASMQPQHQTSDMPWAEARLGPERVRGAYAWRALLDSGALLASGSDAPVEAIAPLLAYHAAVTRTDAQGRPPGGWHPEQAMTRREALLAMTLWPALAAFDEARLGTLAAGKCADLVVLDTDLEAAPAGRLPEARVLLTVFDGRVVYDAENRP